MLNFSRSFPEVNSRSTQDPGGRELLPVLFRATIFRRIKRFGNRNLRNPG